MAKYKIIFDITKTHLLSRIKQTGTATLGVTFGIGTFIILMSFMTGLNGLLDGLILNRTPHIHIFNETKLTEKQPIDLYKNANESFNIVHSVKPKQNQVRIHNALPLIAQLKKDKRVKGVTPQVSSKVFYLGGAIELNGLVNGIDVLEESRLFNFNEYIIEGNPLDLMKMNNGIIIGAGVAEKMSLSLGDRIQVSTASGGILPLKVIGLFQSGLADIDNVQSYVAINTAQQLLGEANNFISNINVKLWDIKLAPGMSKEIQKQFKLTAIDIKTANAQFEAGTQIRNMITYSVSITLLIVAGFGIYNILNMLIYEKMNDIAILKATGFSGRDVKNIFISQAVIIGIIGGVLGLILGFGISVLISNAPFETDALPTIKTYPVNFDPKFYVIGIVFAMISTFLAGYLPAQKAKDIDPVRIIRKQ